MEIEYYNQDSTDQYLDSGSQYYQMSTNNSHKTDYQSLQDIIPTQYQISESNISFYSNQTIPYYYQNEQNNLQNEEQKESNQSQNQMIAKPFIFVERDGYEEIYKPINEDRFFHLPGDVLIEINDGDPMDFSGRQKQILQIHKRPLTTLLELKPVAFSNDFKYITYLLDKSQDQNKHILAKRVKKYQVIVQGFNFLIKHLKKTYEQDLDKLYSISQQREAYKQQFIQDYIKKNFSKDDYFVIAVNGIDFNQENIQIKNIQLSQKLLSVIGLKDDNISYFCLRTGLLDYCNQVSRQQIFNAFMDNFTQIKKGQQLLMKDMHITTLDGLTIVVDAILISISCKFPPELQYHSSYPIPGEIESIFISKVNINETHLKHIATLRQQMQLEYLEKKKHSQMTHYGKEDLQYALETQIFMEKYYPNLYKEFEKIQNQQANEERQVSRGECGFRLIA